MPGILGSVEARAFSQFLHDARHVDSRQPARLHMTVAIHGTEQRAGADGGLFQTGLNFADRASLPIRSVWYPDLAARSLSVRLASAQRQRQAVSTECAI